MAPAEASAADPFMCGAEPGLGVVLEGAAPVLEALVPALGAGWVSASA